MRAELTGSGIIARSAALNFAGHVWLLALGLVSAPILLHQLGTTAYGILALAAVVTGYLGVLDLGIGRAAVKFLSEVLGRDERTSIRRIISTAAASQVLLGMLAAAILAVAAPALVDRLLEAGSPLARQATLAITVMALGLPLLLVGGVYEGALMALQRFDVIAVVRATVGTVRVALAIGLVVAGYGIPGAATAIVVGQAAHVALTIGWTMRLLPEAAGWQLHHPTLRSMLRFGGWVTISSLVGPLLVYLDRFLVAALVSVQAVTYYSLPYDAVTKLWIIPYAIVPALFPAFAALSARPDDRGSLTALYVGATRVTLILMTPIVVVLVAYAAPLLRLWVGEEVAAQGSLALQLLAAGVLINSLAQIPFGVIQAAGRPDLTAKFHLMQVPLHVVLCLWLIPAFGVAGAAGAWSIRVAVDAALLTGAAGRILRQPFRWLLRETVARTAFPLVALVVVAAMANASLTGWLGPWLMAGALAAYPVAVWRFAMSPAERTPFVHLLARLRPAGRTS
jgi:O-antigen/teichoic acid export membrane protein